MRMKPIKNKVLSNKIISILIFVAFVAVLGICICISIDKTTKNKDQNKSKDITQSTEPDNTLSSKQDITLPDTLEDTSLSVIYVNGLDITFIYDFINNYENMEVSLIEMEPEMIEEALATGDVEVDICFCGNVTYEELLNAEIVDDEYAQTIGEVTALIFPKEDKDINYAIKTLLQIWNDKQANKDVNGEV